MNKRDTVLTLLALGATPVLVLAQQAARIPRIGFLRQSQGAVSMERLDAFRRGLGALGYIEGKNILIDLRSSEGQPERLPELAADLVALKVDVIVADSGSQTVAAAKNATKSIPIVFPTAGDPVDQGFVASLSRPGGNITGFSLQSSESAAKSVQLVREILPKARSIGLLYNQTNPSTPPLLRSTRDAARQLGLNLEVYEARSVAEIDAGFAAIGRKRCDTLLVQSDILFLEQGARIARLAAALKLPTIGSNTVMPETGGLASYGPDRLDLLRRTAILVDKILRGAKPADLPVEQPTKFEMVINLKTAKALGIHIPQSVLIRSDRVIE